MSGAIFKNGILYSNPTIATIGGGGGFAPVGTVVTYLGTNPPQDFLPCDGSEYFISDWPQLTDLFISQYGAANHFGGNGTTTFAVPNIVPAQSGVLYCIKAFVTGEGYTTVEHYVGQWIDGKPLYEITITGTTINSTYDVIPTGLSNIDFCALKTFFVSNGTYRRNLLDSVAIKEDGSEIAMVADSESLFKNKSFIATILYTKLTDNVVPL